MTLEQIVQLAITLNEPYAVCSRSGGDVHQLPKIEHYKHALCVALLNIQTELKRTGRIGMDLGIQLEST